VEEPVNVDEALEQVEGTSRFLPPKCITELAQGLRVITRWDDEIKERPDPQVRRRAAAAPPPEEIKIYIAGAVHAPPSKKANAAAGIFIKTDDRRNKGRCLPAEGEQSQYAGEFFAALEAVRSTSKDSTLTIISKHSYVCDAMNKKLARWEHEGWAGVPNRSILRCLAAELKARTASTIFKIAKPGTAESTLCREATLLAKRAARTSTTEEWILTVPKNTSLPGLSLQGNRQRVFYRSIREVKTQSLTPRMSTTKMLKTVREDVAATFGKYVMDADIWKAAAAKDIQPRTGQFLWKGLHNAHRIGKYWNHIPECEDRATCKDCDVLEDLEHILLGCANPGQEIVW
jgi:ribonuclease HI